MNKLQMLGMIILIAGMASACTKDDSISQNLSGKTYSGVTPCADCSGIAFKVSLGEENRYQTSSMYLGRSNRPFIEAGKWNIKEDSLLVLHHDRNSRLFKIRDSSLIMLNQKGKEVTGALAPRYVLNEGDAAAEHSNRKKWLKPGIDFRASGNEPFWSLSIDFDKMIRFKTMNGDSVQTPVPEIKQDTSSKARVFIARTESGTLRVKLFPVGCQDGMSGHIFDYAVKVQRGDETFSGCGNYINKDYELYDSWQLYKLNGKKVNNTKTLRKHPTLRFELANQRVSGNTGCNQLSGSFTRKDSSLNFSKVAMTKMACPGDMEMRFMDAFNKVKSFVIENQELLLMAKKDTLMAFRRAE